MHLAISPVAKVHGMRGCPEWWWWHCGVRLWWDAFPGWKQVSIWWVVLQTVCDAFLEILYHLLTEGQKGEGNYALPPRGFWADLGYSSASGSWLLAVNPIALVSGPRAVCLPSQLCSYSPTQPSLHGPQPSPDV